jgi:hypothetical protein
MNKIGRAEVNVSAELSYGRDKMYAMYAFFVWLCVNLLIYIGCFCVFYMTSGKESTLADTINLMHNTIREDTKMPICILMLVFLCVWWLLMIFVMYASEVKHMDTFVFDVFYSSSTKQATNSFKENVMRIPIPDPDTFTFTSRLMDVMHFILMVVSPLTLLVIFVMH